MGNSLSFCPETVNAFLSPYGLGYTEGPTGTVINGVEYSTVKLVGEGGYALVYEGYNNVTGQRLALKRYVFSDASQQRRAAEEMEIYQAACPNEHVVTYFDSEVVYRPRTAFPEMWIVMEYCEGPSLQGYLNNRIRAGQHLSVPEVYEIADRVIHAIAHLHSMSPPTSHWDIKPDNFLFTESGALKLCDFGSASRLYYQARNSIEVSMAEAELDERMTFLYRSPESLDLWSKQRVDTAADVWALGVLIYVLVFEEMPFDSQKLEIMDAIPKRYRFSTEDPCPPEFRPLMNLVRSQMLVKSPRERADIFAVSSAMEKISELPAINRPHAEGQISQRARFPD